MENNKETRLTKILVRLVGVIYLLIGLGDLVSKILRWVETGEISIGFALLIDLLLIVGGSLLLLLRKPGIEIISIGLRLTALLGPIVIIFALLDGLAKIAAYAGALTLLSIAALVFLSRQKTRAAFHK